MCKWATIECPEKGAEKDSHDGSLYAKDQEILTPASIAMDRRRIGGSHARKSGGRSGRMEREIGFKMPTTTTTTFRAVYHQKTSLFESVCDSLQQVVIGTSFA